jgi:hypothetical protein
MHLRVTNDRLRQGMFGTLLDPGRQLQQFHFGQAA